jgi:hypothetical protein
MKTARVAGLSLIFLVFLISLGCENFVKQQNAEKLEFKTTYQVVFLDNNNAYIGKIQQPGKNFINLTNVYYIQTQVNPETKETSNTLIKRGNELHKPDVMLINMQHIVMIEPVTADSQVAKLIEQSETQTK